MLWLQDACGQDNNVQGADEFVLMSHLLTSSKIFANVIVDLCGIAQE